MEAVQQAGRHLSSHRLLGAQYSVATKLLLHLTTLVPVIEGLLTNCNKMLEGEIDNVYKYIVQYFAFFQLTFIVSNMYSF